MAALPTCPECGGPGTKVMYCGIPLKLCGDDDCACLWGFWQFLFVCLVPWNDGQGWVFIRYESYWTCLWDFLTGKINRDLTR